MRRRCGRLGSIISLVRVLGMRTRAPIPLSKTDLAVEVNLIPRPGPRINARTWAFRTASIAPGIACGAELIFAGSGGMAIRIPGMPIISAVPGMAIPVQWLRRSTPLLGGSRDFLSLVHAVNADADSRS